MKLYSKARSWKAEGDNSPLDELFKKAIRAQQRLKDDLKRTDDKVARLEDELDHERAYYASAKKYRRLKDTIDTTRKHDTHDKSSTVSLQGFLTTNINIGVLLSMLSISINRKICAIL